MSQLTNDKEERVRRALLQSSDVEADHNSGVHSYNRGRVRYLADVCDRCNDKMMQWLKESLQ